MTRGGYGNPAFTEPFINYSQIKCGELILAAENELSLDVSYYPNPVQQFLKIEFSDAAQVEILLYDQQGKLQLRQFVTETTDVDLRNFTSGLYYGVIRNGVNPVRRIRIMKN